MLVNYRSYYRMIFTAVATLGEKKIGAREKDKLFWNHINSNVIDLCNILCDILFYSIFFLVKLSPRALWHSEREAG